MSLLLFCRKQEWPWEKVAFWYLPFQIQVQLGNIRGEFKDKRSRHLIFLHQWLNGARIARSSMSLNTTCCISTDISSNTNKRCGEQHGNQNWSVVTVDKKGDRSFLFVHSNVIVTNIMKILHVRTQDCCPRYVSAEPQMIDYLDEDGHEFIVGQDRKKCHTRKAHTGTLVLSVNFFWEPEAK